MCELSDPPEAWIVSHVHGVNLFCQDICVGILILLLWVLCCGFGFFAVDSFLLVCFWMRGGSCVLH